MNLIELVRLDCQPKSEQDCVMVSLKWRDAIVSLAGSRDPGVIPAEAVCHMLVNAGFDVRCGECASIVYTGTGTGAPHDCGKEAEPEPASVSISQARRSLWSLLAWFSTFFTVFIALAVVFRESALTLSLTSFLAGMCALGAFDMGMSIRKFRSLR